MNHHQNWKDLCTILMISIILISLSVTTIENRAESLSSYFQANPFSRQLMLKFWLFSRSSSETINTLEQFKFQSYSCYHRRLPLRSLIHVRFSDNDHDDYIFIQVKMPQPLTLMQCPKKNLLRAADAFKVSDYRSEKKRTLLLSIETTFFTWITRQLFSAPPPPKTPRNTPSLYLVQLGMKRATFTRHSLPTTPELVYDYFSNIQIDYNSNLASCYLLFFPLRNHGLWRIINNCSSPLCPYTAFTTFPYFKFSPPINSYFHLYWYLPSPFHRQRCIKHFNFFLFIFLSTNSVHD